MAVAYNFESVLTPDGSPAIEIASDEVTTMATLFSHYWRNLFMPSVVKVALPRLRFRYAGAEWLTDTIIPITTRGFLLAAYIDRWGATGIAFGVEYEDGEWELVKHSRWLMGGPGELDNLSPSEACHFFRELEVGRRMP